MYRKARRRRGHQAPEEMTDRELLERYLEVKEIPEDRISALLEHADGVFHQDD